MLLVVRAASSTHCAHCCLLFFFQRAQLRVSAAADRLADVGVSSSARPARCVHSHVWRLASRRRRRPDRPARRCVLVCTGCSLACRPHRAFLPVCSDGPFDLRLCDEPVHSAQLRGLHVAQVRRSSGRCIGCLPDFRLRHPEFTSIASHTFDLLISTAGEVIHCRILPCASFRATHPWFLCGHCRTTSRKRSFV